MLNTMYFAVLAQQVTVQFGLLQLNVRVTTFALEHVTQWTS